MNDLEQDYNKVKSQLRTELDGSTQNKLERQLEQIGQEINKCENQIQACKRKLQDAALDKLREILQRHNAQLGEMQQAYQATVKARSFKRRSTPETIESLITELLKIPQGQSSYTALEEFAAWLTFISNKNDLIRSLQQWGDEHCKGWSKLLRQIETQREEQGKNVQAALFILISYSDEAATQSQDGEAYRLQVWLIENVEQYKTARQGYRTVGLDINSGLTGDETYSWEVIPEVLKQFIEQGNVVDELPPDSEVHIFLPQQLLNCDADCWKLIKRIGRELPIGHHYKVVVRLYERLSRSYNPKPWKRKWQQKKSLLQEKASTGFKGCQDCDLEDLYYELTEEENENVVGLTLIDAPHQDSSISIFELIFEMGFPFALWGRSNLSESTNEVELNRVLDACILANLPKTVREVRRKSRKKPLNCHIGHQAMRELKLGEVLYWSITTRTTLKDGLYTYDAIARLQAVKQAESSGGQTDEPQQIANYITLGPLGTAFLPSQRPRVLVIDEIDKSDIDLPNDLLAIFEEGRFEIAELARLEKGDGNQNESKTVSVRTAYTDDEEVTCADKRVQIQGGRITCQEFPLVILTSNGERDFPPPFLRRCLRLTMREPNRAELERIIKAHLGDEIASRKDVDTLIKTFLDRRRKEALATDQLLNAIFMVTREREWVGDDQEKLIRYLLAELDSSRPVMDK
ncbi:MAG: hypothetical protein RIE73_19340 [Coleofasciculus sp. C1-SOL-03]